MPGQCTLHNLRQIKASGVSIAMDDFGTGHSSLSLLSSFPFDKIKIDRSFISAVGQNARADSIFRAVAGMGKALGCEEVQGYYCSRPIHCDLIEDLLLILDGGSVFGRPAVDIDNLIRGKNTPSKAGTAA